MKVGDLVKWHNTTGGKWKLGIIVSIQMIGDVSYGGMFTVLWAGGKKKQCKRWQLFPLHTNADWTFNTCKPNKSTV